MPAPITPNHVRMPVSFVMLLLAVDIGANAASIAFSGVRSAVVASTAVQLAALVISAMAFSLMLMQTQLFKAGHGASLARKFRRTFLILLLYIILSGVAGALAIVGAQDNSFYWTPGYHAAFALQKLCAVPYWFLMKRALVRLGDAKLYAMD